MATAMCRRPAAVAPKNRYRLLEEMGRGLYTRVVKAIDTQGGGMVAVKMLRTSHRDDPELRTRLAREATALARVRSKNVMPVLDVVLEPHPLYVMPILTGRNLSEYRRRGPAPHASLRALAVALADALGALHAVGLVHRDLSPERVLVVEGRPVVFDLGLVKDLALDEATRALVFAKPEYTAPEVLRGEPTSVASDLYALGMILHEFALGQHPFRGHDRIEVVRRQLEDRPPRLATARPDLPEDVSALLARLVAKEPGKRPRSAFSVSHDLAVRRPRP